MAAIACLALFVAAIKLWCMVETHEHATDMVYYGSFEDDEDWP